MNISRIFNQYRTSEGVPFLNLSKCISFPEDDTLDIYSYFYVSEDTPWTVLSYKLYNSIDYWWVLSSLNKEHKFYAPEGTQIKYIDGSYLKDILGKIIV